MSDKKAKFGFYDLMKPRDEGRDIDVFYYFTPCISAYHFANDEQGAFLIGWLSFVLFMPFDWNTKWLYNITIQFILLPCFSYRCEEGKNVLYFSWLFFRLRFSL